MMTHGNVLATVSAVMTIVPSIGTKDIYLAYLPLAHILELAAEVRGFKSIYLCIYTMDIITCSCLPFRVLDPFRESSGTVRTDLYTRPVAPIAQGYGLTETCAGGSFSEHDDISVGRVGAPLPCSYVKVRRCKHLAVIRMRTLPSQLA
ncbi:hypothetical protein BHE74_00003967 [Ensete ventricosum]|uniref:Uncharacterized protein n=1 Tax=Ensete ventricosum TaxID=4639 RepID=A0A427ASQ9_ENSVE|nr:hypothetical protein B296_00025650 [Ensete ventricosum]RWV95123.1 hypothetical protein GW17_00042279 [Ensete ventricosum]RWW87220.1 hypothetical protein BHE74_00003967 [Ensete ventricosum]